jgi:cell fate regulator YaaT (PSP1 superfamily)
MEETYLIRYGVWRQVGRFASDSPNLERGQMVVVRSHRGTELGEVLIRIMGDRQESPSSTDLPVAPRILRAAIAEDLERAHQLELERPRRFDRCQRVLVDRNETLQILDVELLFDDRRTVLHYLGPQEFDATELLATLRSTCDIEPLLEFVGSDEPEDSEALANDHDEGCGHCTSGGGCRGSGGSCAPGSPTSHGGCSTCGIKQLLAGR